MFVYGMIAAELLLLYVVFWYLFVRDPRHKSYIRPNTWGAYSGDTWGAYAQSRRDTGDLKSGVSLDSQAGWEREFILDGKSNHYIPVSQYQAESFLGRLADKLDRQLSQLNVKN